MSEQVTKYKVLRDGWIAGRRVREGDEIRLTPAQAKYEHVVPVGRTAKTTRRRRRK